MMNNDVIYTFFKIYRKVCLFSRVSSSIKREHPLIGRKLYVRYCRLYRRQAGATCTDKRAETIIRVNTKLKLFTPLVFNVISQLFAYYVAVARGNNIDQPRNLAKSVTVE